jgi:hypothetical protein
MHRGCTRRCRHCPASLTLDRATAGERKGTHRYGNYRHRYGNYRHRYGNYRHRYENHRPVAYPAVVATATCPAYVADDAQPQPVLRGCGTAFRLPAHAATARRASSRGVAPEVSAQRGTSVATNGGGGPQAPPIRTRQTRATN